MIVRVPECTRRAAHHLFIYAQAETSTFFYGLLANGDYVICMPGSGYTEAAMERSLLLHALSGFNACSGLAVLDEEETAAGLIGVAMRDCDIAGRTHVSNMPVRPPCYSSLQRLRGR